MFKLVRRLLTFELCVYFKTKYKKSGKRTNGRNKPGVLWSKCILLLLG